MTEIEVLDHLLALNPELKKNYELMNRIRLAFHLRDWTAYNLAVTNTEGGSEEMTKNIETLRLHHSEIKNTFDHSYSYGPLKVVKHVSFVFRNFHRFRIKLFYTLKVHTKKVLITK